MRGNWISRQRMIIKEVFFWQEKPARHWNYFQSVKIENHLSESKQMLEAGTGAECSL